MPDLKSPTQPPPRNVETWIFDLDNTLYPSSCRLFDQVDRNIGAFIASHLGLDPVAARTLQKQYFRTYGTTLRGMMDVHGVDPHAYMDFVHAIDLSGVPANPALDTALGKLPGRKIIFTNGSVKHAANILGHLGIAGHFEAVYDITAAAYRPKPQPEPYDDILQRYGVTPHRAVMVEDMARNLEPAAARGLTTVWVRSETDWAIEGSDADYVHHTVDDLAAWLHAAA